MAKDTKREGGHITAVRLSDAEYRRILRAALDRAKKKGGRISVSGYMRDAALAAAAKG